MKIFFVLKIKNYFIQKNDILVRNQICVFHNFFSKWKNKVQSKLAKLAFLKENIRFVDFLDEFLAKKISKFPFGS